jgi:hypothetical protein
MHLDAASISKTTAIVSDELVLSRFRNDKPNVVNLVSYPFPFASIFDSFSQYAIRLNIDPSTASDEMTRRIAAAFRS